MNPSTEFVVRSFLIGVGATAGIDLWALVLKRFGIASLDFALLGRWVGHLTKGQVFHNPIGKSAPISHELAIGWVAHYSIGISLSALMIATFGLAWARSPTLSAALLFGVVTVAAPLLILQPALGAGIASSKTPTPLFNSVKSLVTHTVFGLGLYTTARGTATLIPWGN